MGQLPSKINGELVDQLAKLPTHDLNPEISKRISTRAHHILRGNKGGENLQTDPPPGILPRLLTPIFLTGLGCLVLFDVIKIILYIYQ